MNTIKIAIAAAAALTGAALATTHVSAAPFGGPGGFKPGPMKPIGPGGFKPGGFKPGGFKPGGFKPGGFKPGPGGLVNPGKPSGGGGAWKPPHKGHGHGHWGKYGWGYAAAGLGAAYFARPVYTTVYAECEWVRVRTVHGWRWRPYC